MVVVAVIAGVAAVFGVTIGAVVRIVLMASSDVANPLSRCEHEDE